jgi:hypothetical protein
MLDPEQRRALLDVLTKVEEREIPTPRVAGEVGQFLGEWSATRDLTAQLLGSSESFVSGRDLGPISLTPILPVAERVVNEVMGEVATVVAASEALGAVVNVSLWGSARPANRLRNIWLRRPDSSVILSGAFRWYAPRRVTPGSANVEQCVGGVGHWSTCRCLKFVGEEFHAPPTAASYRWESSLGFSEFRTFRSVILRRVADGWGVVPATGRELVTAVGLAASRERLDSSVGPLATLCAALVWRDPWNESWSVAAAVEVGPDHALAHLVAWADYKRELLGDPPSAAAEAHTMSQSLIALGVRADVPSSIEQANLVRQVLPRAQPVAAWLRGLG